VNEAAFGFEAEVAFALGDVVGGGDDLAVDGEGDVAVVALDAVVVPFGRGLGAGFGGVGAAFPFAGVAGGEGCAVDGEDVALGGEAVATGAVKYLVFDGAGEGDALGGERVGPDEEAGVSAGAEVAPFEFDDEVFVHFFGSEDTGGEAGADDLVVFDDEGVIGGAGRGDVDGDPTGEIFVVEERGEVVVGGGEGWEGQRKERNQKGSHGSTLGGARENVNVIQMWATSREGKIRADKNVCPTN